MLWWALGHSSQQINVAAMVAIWYMLGALTVGAVVLNEKVSRSAFVLYILFISMASAHHLLVDPGFGPAWKIVNTSYFMYMAVLASMVHGFTVPAGMELGMRLRGYTDGLFGWLRRAPWGDPGFSSLVLSIVVFGFVGGITGVTIGTEQINIIAHNTLRIPGHFHSTVVSGTAMAFMGATYYLLAADLPAQGRVLGLREDPAVPLLRRHAPAGDGDDLRRQLRRPAPSLGHLVLPGAVRRPVQSGGGHLPRGDGDRRHHRRHRRRSAFILIAVKSVFFGEPLAEITRGVEMVGRAAGAHPPAGARADVDERNAALHDPKRGIAGATPGTLVLVAVFLLAFVVYYFANWKLLSFLWKIG